ncbi:LamG-like jellyroll fold domain-containing protein [Mucilaginibacter sp. OK098]|uniref:LamG-like jellyroll fold domain-containing protein n=1 Tax=Mucilaginibacter sp. OK098 TaxID=1855297 RepID=UPI00135672BA|nr:LamG-like jellyroll fold domain-containing protein [Mucilaginibacter sp. OK098]
MSFAVDGGSSIAATMSGTTGSASIPTTGLSYGAHTLTVTGIFHPFIGSNVTKTNSITFLVKPVQPDITTGSYGFSIPITLKMSSTSVSAGASLTAFPALVYIQSDSLKIGKVCGDKVQFPTGNGGGAAVGTNYDFAFTETGTNTELYYQVDTYDSVNGILLAWVQVPALTKADKTLTFYFGSQSPSHSSAFSASTWPSDYLAVYHFSEGSPTATVLDATLHARNAVQANTAITNDEIHVAAGIPTTGGAYTFNGTNTSIIQNTGTFPDCTSQFTVSAWVTYTGTSTSDNKLVSDQLDYGHGYKLSVRNSTIESETRTAANPVPGNVWDAGTPVSPNTWSYVQGEYNGSSFLNYLNGSFATGGAFKPGTNSTNAPPEAGNYLTMGLDHGTGTANGGYNDAYFFSGVMDEVRISNIAKSADWVSAEYYNQKNPKLFTVCNAVATNAINGQTLNAGALIYSWKGSSSNSLTTAANWDIGVPDLSTGKTSLVIPTGCANYPKLTASGSIYGLTIANGASIDLNGKTLNVGCNIINKVTTGGVGILDASILLAVTTGNSANATGTINWNGTLKFQVYKSTNNVSNTAELSNMTVSNTNLSPGTITITGGPMDIYNILKISQGNLVIDNSNSGLLTLKSNATQTAAVDVMPSSYSVQGIVNVERFLNGGGLAGNRGYRLLSSPVNQTADVAGILTTPNTFGLFYLGLHSYGGVNNYPGALTIGIGGVAKGFGLSNNNPTIYFYDESQVFNGRSFTQGNHAPVYAINSTSSGSGVNLITTSTENIGSLTNVSVPVGNGFLMYFVGPSSRTDAWAATLPADVTMTANGHLNQGTIPVKLWTSATTLSYTTGTAVTHPYPGLNMVGNPYPSTIDLSKVLSDNAASINGIYVLSARNSPNQTYLAYTANGTSAPNQGYAVSGEGFFVRATGTGKTLTFLESEKVPATQLTGAALIMSTPNTQVKGVGGQVAFGQNSLAAAVPQGDALTGLYMKIEKDSVTYNYCGIYFRKDWSATFAEDDAKDMNATSGPAIISSLTSDNIRASVNHMPDYTKGVNVKLYANASADGQYKLKIEDIRNIDTLYDIYLIDHYKKDSLDIRRYGTYLFDISKADTSSFGASRFELSVRPRPLPVYRLLNFTAQKVSGGVQVSWKTEAESNYTGFVLQKQDGTTFNPLYSKQGDGGGIYTFTDPSPVTGANTYRLQQDNIVGAISLSPAITIIYNPAGQAGLMSVYPNPTKATISVNVSSMTSAAPTYKANIYNSAGQLMMQRSVSSNSWTEDVTQYTPGAYIIQLKDNSGNLIGKSKFVKTN